MHSASYVWIVANGVERYAIRLDLLFLHSSNTHTHRLQPHKCRSTPCSLHNKCAQLNNDTGFKYTCDALARSEDNSSSHTTSCAIFILLFTCAAFWTASGAMRTPQWNEKDHLKIDGKLFFFYWRLFYIEEKREPADRPDNRIDGNWPNAHTHTHSTHFDAISYSFAFALYRANHWTRSVQCVWLSYRVYARNSFLFMLIICSFVISSDVQPK